MKPGREVNTGKIYLPNYALWEQAGLNFLRFFCVLVNFFIFLSAEKFPNNKTKTMALGFKVELLKNKYSTFPAVKVAILSISGPAHLEK